jgi:beta-phosphoglucomutase-like phosphatase (HAD superfamily)
MRQPMKTIEVPNHIRGLIFDCDGTLVDSMPLHMKAWKHAITEAGLPWDYEFFFSKKGMEGRDILEEYGVHIAAALDADEICGVKQEYFLRHFTEIRPLEPVVSIALRYKGILPMAVASGGKLSNVQMELDSAKIGNIFTALVTADDDVAPKPSPDIFLEAARRLNVPPYLCQVFEDGDLGLEAAGKAGMLVTDVRPFLEK